ncbi:hypothetical protein LBMAG56_35810 [Verrucomicrobiota bacterium]|nr:hypothetical protein LBMAG56_35810 [Verrucomicrobiota bacterium]
MVSFVPDGTWFAAGADPALKCWAIVGRPLGWQRVAIAGGDALGLDGGEWHIRIAEGEGMGFSLPDSPVLRLGLLIGSFDHLSYEHHLPQGFP